MEYMYITKNPQIATIVESAGVERVWVDLEQLGKEQRQKGCNSVKSKHSIHDVDIIRKTISRSKLQVRINPINTHSKEEIYGVVDSGADIIMLPYYKSINEVEQFLNYVNGRVTTVLLLETKEANECLDETLKIQEIDEIHIGLNDLHLSYHKKFMFELLIDGTVETICSKLRTWHKPYGFGGIARLGHGVLPAEKILCEHFRLGSTRAILSRSFCDTENIVDLSEVEVIFKNGMNELRNYETFMSQSSEFYFEKNRESMSEIIKNIAENM